MTMKWPGRIAEAKAIQQRLAGLVRICRLRHKPGLVAGVDAAFSRTHVFAAASLLTFPGLDLVEETTAVEPLRFPYVPGYLSFREGDAIVRAVRRLGHVPDLLLVDGQGIAHPRGLGIASHIGVLLDLATVGCAKSRLIGEFTEPGLEKGSWSPLLFEGKKIGAVVRTRTGVRPLFVSPGHRINLTDAVAVVLAGVTEFRIPEPLRRADVLSKRTKREESIPAKKGGHHA